METQLATDSTLSGLDLLFKEQLVTDQNVVLKVSGVFSTVSGLREYAGSLHKYFSFGRNSRRSSSGRSSYKRDKGLFKLGAGVSYRHAPFLQCCHLLCAWCLLLLHSVMWRTCRAVIYVCRVVWQGVVWCRSDFTVDTVLCGLTAKKQFPVVTDDCWLKFVTSADYNTKTQEASI